MRVLCVVTALLLLLLARLINRQDSDRHSTVACGGGLVEEGLCFRGIAKNEEFTDHQCYCCCYSALLPFGTLNSCYQWSSRSLLAWRVLDEINGTWVLSRALVTQELMLTMKLMEAEFRKAYRREDGTMPRRAGGVMAALPVACLYAWGLLLTCLPDFAIRNIASS